MMRGTVDDDLGPVVRFQVRGPAGQVETIEALVDTGFGGTLALPAATIAALGLRERPPVTATFADGTTGSHRAFRAGVA